MSALLLASASMCQMGPLASRQDSARSIRYISIGLSVADLQMTLAFVCITSDRASQA